MKSAWLLVTYYVLQTELSQPLEFDLNFFLAMKYTQRMAANSFGNIFRITTFGESHGKAVGVVIDGCPAGLAISDDEINAINDASARSLLTALAAHIREGVAAGEMADVDPEAAAQFLLAVRSGLEVAARGGAGFDALRSIARMALRSLRG